MAHKVIILYRLYMPYYFLGTFTEYPFDNSKSEKEDASNISQFDTPSILNGYGWLRLFTSRHLPMQHVDIIDNQKLIS